MTVASLKRWLVERWWSKWSVWLLVVADLLAEAATYLPELQEALPGNWYRWAFRVILLARIIKQTRKANANAE